MEYKNLYGQEKEKTSSVSTNVVKNLSKNLLNSGRTIVADKYYTNLKLANISLEQQTHYIGISRSNRRGNPKKEINKKLKKGEVFGLNNNRVASAVQKPWTILEYNQAKSSVAQLNQMSSYNSLLRKPLE